MPLTTQKMFLTFLEVPFFFYTLRAIWLARNNFILKNIPLNATKTTNTTIEKAVEFWSNSSLSNGPSPTISILPCQTPMANNSHLTWHPPNPFWYKLNCDGSVANSLMGTWGCLHDTYGNWIFGFSSFFGKGNSLQAELGEILQGLHLISQLPHIRNVVIEIVSSQSIDLLMHSNPVFHSMGITIENCRLLLSNLES